MKNCIKYIEAYEKGFKAGAKMKKNIRIIFELSVITPYTVNEITDFMSLTGLVNKDLIKCIKDFNNCGIASLIDIVKLVKIGYFKLPK